MNDLSTGYQDTYIYTGGAISGTVAMVPIIKITSTNTTTKDFDIDYFSLTYASARN